MYCEKCFNDLPGDDVEMADDPSQPGLYVLLLFYVIITFEFLKLYS